LHLWPPLLLLLPFSIAIRFCAAARPPILFFAFVPSSVLLLRVEFAARIESRRIGRASPRPRSPTRLLFVYLSRRRRRSQARVVRFACCFVLLVFAFVSGWLEAAGSANLGFRSAAGWSPPAMGATRAPRRRRRRGWGAPARRRPPRPLAAGVAEPVRLDPGGSRR